MPIRSVLVDSLKLPFQCFNWLTVCLAQARAPMATKMEGGLWPWETCRVIIHYSVKLLFNKHFSARDCRVSRKCHATTYQHWRYPVFACPFFSLVFVHISWSHPGWYDQNPSDTEPHLCLAIPPRMFFHWQQHANTLWDNDDDCWPVHEQMPDRVAKRPGHVFILLFCGPGWTME